MEAPIVTVVVGNKPRYRGYLIITDLTETLFGFVFFDLKLTFRTPPKGLLVLVVAFNVPSTAETPTFWTNLKSHVVLPARSDRFKLLLQRFQEFLVIQNVVFDAIGTAFHDLPQLVIDLRLIRSGVRFLSSFLEVLQDIGIKVGRDLDFAVLKVRSSGLRFETTTR